MGILLVNNTNQNNLNNEFIDCTNAIESYYSSESIPLRGKITKLINSIPEKLRKLIMGKIKTKNYILDVKDTRVFIVHGEQSPATKHGKILSGIDLDLAFNILKWLIYTKILLDIKVPEINIYNELYFFMGNINNKDSYTEYRY